MGLSNRMGLTDIPRDVFNFRLFWSVGVFGMYTIRVSVAYTKDHRYPWGRQRNRRGPSWRHDYAKKLQK